jgi:molybdate transport repressor ModE-like protein
MRTCHASDGSSAHLEALGRSFQAMAVFVRLAQEGSFTSAARALGISTPSVSKCVARLEQRLGVRLVERTTRSFALTEAGKTLARHCQRILRAVDAAESAVAKSGDPRA